MQDREQAPNSEQGVAGGKLPYMMKQWRAFDKKKKEEGSSSSGSKEHHRCPCSGKKEEKGPWG